MEEYEVDLRDYLRVRYKPTKRLKREEVKNDEDKSYSSTFSA